MMSQFRFGHAAAADWRQAADRCLEQVGSAPGSANLGFLYVTDLLVEDLEQILAHVRQSSGVEQWVGAVGIGICATGVEYYDQPAIAMMLGEFPEDEFRVFPAQVSDLAAIDVSLGDWLCDKTPYLGLVHGDPASGEIESLVKQLAGRTSSGFLVGGLASSRRTADSIANGIARGGVSGVLFTDRIGLATGQTQGCTPISPHHTITECQRNILIGIDGRSAFEVLKESLDESQADNLGQLAGLIFVGLPIPGSDTGDYVVRKLVGVDPNHGLLAIGEMVEEEQQILFCRRDRETAREDLDRMLRSLKRRLAAPPRGGIYVSCLGRGAALFGPDSAELGQIQATLGDFPLVGFYASGEVSQDRVYGYTGVLTLFT